MRNSEGIEVFVKSVERDEAYVEYAVPDVGDQTSPDKMERYIEAVTGEQFAIAVKIPADFEYHTAEGVGIGVQIGDTDGYHFRRKSLACNRKGIEYVRDTLLYHIDGQWKHCTLSFNEVEMGTPCDTCCKNVSFY